ncbi:UNVERIFIED_CONTAM: Pentatricopeptide repeat-containing protein, mitochondrial [Sesamum calycinum]|uniref:Pentatricopeptide repeat-containing protein, mitochondrial n=1 Tax=Sesamum calycinum TaxID=2727403 RepID=A0AAW2SF21_9LAMI
MGMPQSTYCYDMDGRIQLLYLLESDSLYGIMHKVLVLLIKECSSSHDEILKLIGAVDDMREKAGFRINYPCYSMLLMCLAKLDMGVMAFLVFKRMLGDGFVASGIDYRTVVNALCKNGFVQAAEMFVSIVLKRGFALDVYWYTSLVLGNCRVGDLGEAFRVFALMSEGDECGVNSAAYSILVHGLCEAGRLDEAYKLKEDMSERGCEPSTRTYTVLIKATCDRGLVDQAFSLLDEMIKKGCKPNVYTYTVLIDVFCRIGKIEQANGMFKKMLKDGFSPGTVTYNALINGYCKEGRVVCAFELLGVMERKKCKPNIRTYNELIEGLCKVGRPHKAVELLRKIINNGLFPTEVTFNILIDGFCRAGELNKAFEILHSMSSYAIEPNHFSYTMFIDSLQNGKIGACRWLFGVMIKKGISLGEVTLTALIGGYCKTGNLKYALLLFEEMVENRCLTSPHTCNIFLDFLGKEAKLVEVNAMFGTHETSRLSTECLYVFYSHQSLCQSGRLEDAEKLLIEMQKAAVSPNVIIYAILVKSYVAAGRLTCAFDVVSAMFQDGCRPNSQIYSELLAGILESEMDGSTRAGNYSAALNAEVEQEEYQKADILIREMVKWPQLTVTSVLHSYALLQKQRYGNSLEWITRFHAYRDPSFASYSAVIVVFRMGRLKKLND